MKRFVFCRTWLLVLLLMLFAGQTPLVSFAEGGERGVVNVSTTVNVRGGPGTQYDILTTPQGAYVQLKNGHELTQKGVAASEDPKNPEPWYEICFLYEGESYTGYIYGIYVTLLHSYDGDCDSDCNTCGEARRAPHSYDTPCDPQCNHCGALREVSHSFGDWQGEEDRHWKICSLCSERSEENDHSYADDCDEDCEVCLARREDAHRYDDDCDEECNRCGASRQAPHSLSTWFSEEEGHWNYCLLCEEVFPRLFHVYDHPCDPECNDCGWLRATEHSFTSWQWTPKLHHRSCKHCGQREEGLHRYEEDGARCMDCGYWRSGYIVGDANGDTQVNFSDIQRIYQHLSTENKLADVFLCAADSNADGAVTFSDIQCLYYRLSQEEEEESYRWPVPDAYNRLSQEYKGKEHTGIDIPTNRTSVETYAMTSGTVIVAQAHYSYGNYVVIDHGVRNGKALRTLYAHLDRILVEVGQEVEQGEIIGMTGTTGNSTGIHLHFMVYEDGAHVNPLTYVKQP